jgi:hypothetical protein
VHRSASNGCTPFAGFRSGASRSERRRIDKADGRSPLPEGVRTVGGMQDLREGLGGMAPSNVGLYNPAFEHDACGVAMVVDMHGRKTRDIVDKAITALLNLEHRGAQGAEPHSGDGAGILLQVPDEFLRAVVDFELPPAGSYATGMAFLPQSSKDAAAACAA